MVHIWTACLRNKLYKLCIDRKTRTRYNIGYYEHDDADFISAFIYYEAQLGSINEKVVNHLSVSINI